MRGDPIMTAAGRVGAVVQRGEGPGGRWNPMGDALPGCPRAFRGFSRPGEAVSLRGRS